MEVEVGVKHQGRLSQEWQEADFEFRKTLRKIREGNIGVRAESVLKEEEEK